MSSDMIDHGTLARLAEARAIEAAHVVGQPGGWSLRVSYGAGEHALAAQRSRQVRVFRQIETLVSYLKKMGIDRFDVDAENYSAEVGSTRPDRSEALREAHRAVVHDRWFRDQVAAAIKDADNPGTKWVAHEDVKQDLARQRAALIARIKGDAE